MPPPPRSGGAKSKPPQTREVTISKNLGYLLRHGAKDEGVEMDEGGWVCVRDVLLWRRVASLRVTLAELLTIVSSNDKQRFQLIPKDPSTTSPTPSPNDDPSAYLIRATQGHSLTTILDEKLLTPVLADHADCPTLVVHGTYPKFWAEIRSSGGLKAMGRRHIHFARGEPGVVVAEGEVKGGSDAGKGEEVGGVRVEELRAQDTAGRDKVISGMRKGASVLIWVDVKRSLAGGVKWFRSANGVFLTEGVEKTADVGGRERERERVLGFEWIRWVERRGDGEVLWKAEGMDVQGERLARRMEGVGLVGGQKGG